MIFLKKIIYCALLIVISYLVLDYAFSSIPILASFNKLDVIEYSISGTNETAKDFKPIVVEEPQRDIVEILKSGGKQVFALFLSGVDYVETQIETYDSSLSLSMLKLIPALVPFFPLLLIFSKSYES